MKLFLLSHNSELEFLALQEFIKNKKLDYEIIRTSFDKIQANDLVANFQYQSCYEKRPIGFTIDRVVQKHTSTLTLDFPPLHHYNL